MLLLKMMYQGFKRFEDEYKENLLDDYFLMGSPLKIISVIAIYWYFVMKFGQKWMKDRPPFDLKNTMLIYNALQVIVNGYVVYLSFKIIWSNPFYADWSCMRRTEPVASNDELHGFYVYYLLKVSDFMDTIFMVLRKRNRQITFLHVYHHILMVACAYFGTRYLLAGQTVMIGCANGLVHMIMYSYYFLAAQRPGLRNSIGVKKYITQMQLTQFFFLMVHFARALFNPECDQPKWLMFFGLSQGAIMVGLFSNFYYQAYCKPMIKAKKEKEEKNKT